MRAGIKKLILLAVIAAAGYYGYMFFFHKEPTVYGLTTSAITRGDIVSTVTATGELNALNVVTVGTQVSGTIQELYVDFNSVVTKGQILAQIDPANAQQTLRQQQATLAGYEAAMQSAQASLKDEERQLARNKELFQRKLIARSTVDTSETNVAMKKASLNEARARVVNGRAAVEKAKTDLSYTRITSPVDGIIIDRQVDVGQTVAASYQTPTLFKVARDLTRMQIETKVDEADIGTVKEGQNVTFRVDAFPEETFNGKVVQVRIAPIKSDSVVTYTVIIHVNNSELKLKPGMTANVSIETAKAVNVLRIPVAALRFTPPEELLNTISFDREILTQKKGLKEGTLWPERDGIMMRPVQIETGVSDNRNVELVNEKSGRERPVLREGTELVINAQAGVKTGTTTTGGMLGGPRRGPGGGRPPR